MMNKTDDATFVLFGYFALLYGGNLVLLKAKKHDLQLQKKDQKEILEPLFLALRYSVSN